MDRQDGADNKEPNPLEELKRSSISGIISSAKRGEHSKCLIELHNCTPYHVKPYWVNFDGDLVKYPTIPIGRSLPVNTFVTHTWFFSATCKLNVNEKYEKADDDRQQQNHTISPRVLEPPATQLPYGRLTHRWSLDRNPLQFQKNFQPDRIVAVPEELIIPQHYSLNSMRYLATEDPFDDYPEADRSSEEAERIKLVHRSVEKFSASKYCRLCAYVIAKVPPLPDTTFNNYVPCKHFTGETKFLLSNLDQASWSDYSSPYMSYSCNAKIHKIRHSKKRRNVYLVVPAYNLKEHCFKTLSGKVKGKDIPDLDLPVVLKEEYLRYLYDKYRCYRSSFLIPSENESE